MQVDSYFAIGSSHDVCEDYALHSNEEAAFAVLSDGCSSSDFTDFGARFLCLAAKEALKLSTESEFNTDAVLPIACSLLGKTLPFECLDATVGVLHTTQHHTTALLAGDGVLVARSRDGEFWVCSVEFSNNAPGYLTYLLNPRRYEIFRTGTPQEPGALRQVTETRWSPDFSEKLEEFTDTKVVDPSENNFWLPAVFPRDSYDLVMLFSDGVCSFTRITDLGLLAPVPLKSVLKQLLQFKQMKGRFVARRWKRFDKKYCTEQNWSHYDDFSMIAVYDDEWIVSKGVDSNV